MKVKLYCSMFCIILISVLFSCKKVELDSGNWGTKAEITSVSLYQWQIEDITLNEETQGAKTVVVSTGSNVDPDAFKVTVTVPASIDLSKTACFIYFKGKSIEPLTNAPTPGIVGGWSTGSFNYRVHSTNGVYIDWTITVVEQ